MAKVRVYELAKELNMESKALVEKLIAGGMNIKNYMSTLDEEAVVRAKEVVSGAVAQVIEEKRIKPTVIRRRKKSVKVEPVSPVAEVEMKPEEREPVPSEVEIIPEEIPVAVTEEPVTSDLDTALEPGEAEGIQAAEPGVTDEVTATETIAPGLEGEVEIPSEHEKEKAVERVKAKRAKKRKTVQPARIIKRPEEGPLREVLAKQEPDKPVRLRESVQKPEPAEPLAIAKEVAEKAEKAEKAKPAKRKKGREGTEGVEISPRARVRYRKKEIFERADLYEGKVPRRKEKKAPKRTKELVRQEKHTEITTPKAIKRRVKVQEFVTVADLGKAMGIKGMELIKKLLELGIAANINQPIDFETASVVADDYGYELELDTFEEDSLLGAEQDRPEDLSTRPPVVTIMGHVDHGKTSLLDYIRKSNITAGESGGITQHIGAYYVEAEGGDITFLDTPGHEAFTAMRARGARVTDLIVLVVAADDGVMPQTKEAINHARAAEIPILVAINKIDKPESNPDKVKRQLAELELAPEEWGGQTVFGEISAKTGEGVDDLLGLITLQSELLELKGNPSRQARGTIIEARLDKTKGPVATVLIKNGTLRSGEYFICGEHYGRVRAMVNHLGKSMKLAGPSVPVEMYGISGVPMAGDEFVVVPDEKTAKQVIEHRKLKGRKVEVTRRGIVSLDDLFEKIREGEVKELNIILKTDVQGSLEALSDSLVKLSTDEVKLRIIHSSAGAITESDILLASASGAIIIGFNVRGNPRVYDLAEKEGVDIRYYDVIYNVLQDIRSAMAGLLEPVYKEQIVGRVNIKETFHVPKVGTVAGCYVSDGHIERNSKVRLLRDDVVIFDGKIASLKRFKEDVKEVQSGYECGIGLDSFQDVKPGDILEVYELQKIEAEL